jgi:hypothetical protein
MGFLTDKKGNLSMVRVSVLTAVIGGVFLIGGIFAFFLDQESRKSPLMIETPPGAIQMGELPKGNAWRDVFYTVAGGDINAILAFYERKMLEHYANTPESDEGERCIRFPLNGNFVEYDEGRNPLPFYFTCMFDRSGLNSTQWTQITIRPAIATDTGIDIQNTVVIVYEQRWQAN